MKTVLRGVVVMSVFVSCVSFVSAAKGLGENAEQMNELTVVDESMPMPIDPGIGWGGGYDYPWYYNELESFFQSVCTSNGDALECGEYTALLESLEPKVDAIIALFNTKIKQENRVEMARQLGAVVETKYREVTTTRAKLIVSYVRLRIQMDIIEESLEDIESRLGGAIDDMTQLGKIVAITSTDEEITTVSDDTVTTKNNILSLSVEAEFESGRPVTSEAGYQVMAYFWDMGTYFLDRNKMVYATYDYASKTRSFANNGAKLPNEDKVTFYLTCYNCEAPVMHKQDMYQKAADKKEFTFVETNDDVAFDVALNVETFEFTVSSSDEVTLDITYTIQNTGTEPVEGVQTSLYGDGYYEKTGMYAGDRYSTMKRSIVTATCNGKNISEDDFLMGNIMLPGGKNCTVTETTTFGALMEEGDVTINIGLSVNAAMDQDRNNNNRNFSKVISN